MAVVLKQIRFGEYLVEQGVLDDAQLLDCLAIHWDKRCRLGDAICFRGYASRDAVERWARRYEALQTVFV